MDLTAHSRDSACEPGAAGLLIDEGDGLPRPGEPRGLALLMRPKAAVDIVRHPGVEGAVAAPQDVEGPIRGARRSRGPALPDLHFLEHAPVARFQRTAPPLAQRGYAGRRGEVNRPASAARSGRLARVDRLLRTGL
ncbi:MAG: hypothetical protein MZU84_05965 [Sphingobacterium sp.]|nr:hypothetical protein [Sphingobacterium sp.]